MIPEKDGQNLREEDLLRVFTLSPDMVAVSGFDGYFKRLNASWEKALGWTREELMSKPTMEFIHPEDHAATVLGMEQLYKGLQSTPSNAVCSVPSNTKS